jgi:hypothetical protein
MEQIRVTTTTPFEKRIILLPAQRLRGDNLGAGRPGVTPWVVLRGQNAAEILTQTPFNGRLEIEAE